MSAKWCSVISWTVMLFCYHIRTENGLLNGKEGGKWDPGPTK